MNRNVRGKTNNKLLTHMKNSNTRITKILAVLALGGTLMSACFAGKTLKWEDVPKPVQETLQKAGVKVIKVDLEGNGKDGKAIYEAEVKDKDGKIKDLVIDADGKLLETKTDTDYAADAARETAASAELKAAGLDKLAIAHVDDRIDMKPPQFDSSSAKVTNPLFPISQLHSAILNGKSSGKTFRVETTLLPRTRVIELPDGQVVRALVSQYVAYEYNRIEEVAIDLYAQDTSGAVWYLGEDVFNYEEGRIRDRAGTWRADMNGPAAMIMPAKPKVGGVFRPENALGFVFEEVRITEIDKEVTGPRGIVKGAITCRELHQDGTTEQKIFAPGYGEFSTGEGNDLEALAVAIPTDALGTAMPQELSNLSTNAEELCDAAIRHDVATAATAFKRMTQAWTGHCAKSHVPPRLKEATDGALKSLKDALSGADQNKVSQSSLDVLLAVLDLQLQYRPVVSIDVARFDLWLRRIDADAQAKDDSGMRSDIATLEWVRDRIVDRFDKIAVTHLNNVMNLLRESINDMRFDDAVKEAAELRAHLKSSFVTK